MATPTVSPTLLESAEPAGLVARMNANLAFDLAAEPRDAHHVEGDARLRPAFHVDPDLEAHRAAAEAARRRLATEVWVRVVAPGRGYRGASFAVVGTIQDMEQRHYEETDPDAEDVFAPNLVGLRTADQLPRGVTNDQLLRLIQIREEIEREEDDPYWPNQDAIRRLKAEETRILRTLECAFRAHRALLAAAVAHAPAVVSGEVRAARIHRRRLHALAAFGRVN